MTHELVAIAKQSGVPFERVLEEWNERAAIRQHEGGLPRGGAESCAVDDVRGMFAGEASRPDVATLAFAGGARYVPDGEEYW